MLVGSFGAKREFAAVSTTNEHVIDLTVERQCQRVRTPVTVSLSTSHHERAILNIIIIVVD